MPVPALAKFRPVWWHLTKQDTPPCSGKDQLDRPALNEPCGWPNKRTGEPFSLTLADSALALCRPFPVPWKNQLAGTSKACIGRVNLGQRLAITTKAVRCLAMTNAVRLPTTTRSLAGLAASNHSELTLCGLASLAILAYPAGDMVAVRENSKVRVGIGRSIGRCLP